MSIFKQFPKTPVDIIIPLGTGSKSNNDELKILLRSIEQYASRYKNIWIVTSNPPDWLVEDSMLHILYREDKHTSNKDANIFEKVRMALKVSKADNVIYTADDRAFLMKVDLSALPPIFNSRKIDSFTKENATTWQKRMAATLKEINLLDGNWDSHVPQLWNKKAALEAMKNIPYTAAEGRCINSAVMGRIYNSEIPPFAIDQREIKETAEKEDISKIKLNKLLIGYNDSAFLNGLREKLFKRFPFPSRWEIGNTRSKDIIEIGIVHYNTPELLSASIKSINKHVPKCHITVLDNSQTSGLYVPEFDNVTILDNCEQQLINFDNLITMFENRIPSPGNDYGSAKHCYSIEYLIYTIQKPVFIIESDVLLTKDITDLADESQIFVGTLQHKKRGNKQLPDRIVPFLCYINYPMMKKYGIHYFDFEKMWDLSDKWPNNRYDTGAAFYEKCVNLNLPFKLVDVLPYIKHLGHGSWRKKNIASWLEEHKELYY